MNVKLDFNLTEEQAVALQLHMLLKDKGAYNVITEDKTNPPFDTVEVFLNQVYNDYLYDITVPKLQLLNEGKVVKDIMPDFEIEDQPGNDSLDDYVNYSFTITKEML